ncbi:uncharacterized protein C10orf67 homolog, mitochondrial [Lacerta agilis]|uniref:uncharacterized protein C10orf67 homolog, mitochondrial n=1 Tax=Lacerta agilis TaxID=80427 RepID=UPI001419C1FC|nr:uncharacterized protein C10orf67 homolog, mitochondrial [Lacerta agilis]
MAQALSLPNPPFHEEEDMGATERARALQSTRRLSMYPNILELLTVCSSFDELELDYRHTISDNLKIGFGISDHATQTDTSEIGDIKVFIETTRILLKFTNTLYNDFAMYQKILKAQYEERIQEEATKLWLAINDRLKYIDDFYKQKELKMRYSYQQQLCDALAILKTNYTKYFLLDPSEEGGETVLSKLQILRGKLEEQAATIESLEAEVTRLKQTSPEKVVHDLVIEKELLQQANSELKGENANLLDKLKRAQEVIKLKAKEMSNLEAEIKHMQDKRQNDMKTIEKLQNTQEIMKLELDREKQRVLAKALEVKEAQEAVKMVQAAAAAAAEPKVPSMQEGKIAKKGKKGLKGKVVKAAAAFAATATKEARQAAAKEAELLEDEKKALQEEIKRLRKSERDAKLRVKRLEQELSKSSRSWEMKFEILKKSLHAIKDEMFLRQSLRQSAKFRHPSLADKTAPPLHIQHPTGKMSSFSSSLYMQYAPLPKIGSQPDSGSNEDEEGMDTEKIPVLIKIPSAFEAASESADEEEFEQLPSSPSSVR